MLLIHLGVNKIICYFDFIYFLTIIPSYFSPSSLFLKKSKTVAFTNLVITLLFFITGFVLTFYFNVKSKTASTISFIPFLIMLIFLIIYSFVQGKFVKINAEEELENRMEIDDNYEYNEQDNTENQDIL